MARDPDDPDARLRETTAERRVVYRGSLINFEVDTVCDADGRLHQREIVDHPGAVAILALDGEELLMVRQYRSAAGRILLEIPAGTLERRDGAVEPPDEAAARELAEETGHEAGSWRRLGTFWTAPGFSSEALTLYLAGDLRPRDGAGPDADERLDLVRLPWPEAVERAERGEIADAKSLVGIFWLARLMERGEA